MHQIDGKIRSIMEDRRAGYLWSTKQAAAAVGCHPNKFQDWWARTQSKLIALATVMPGETAAELAALIAQALAERDRLEREGGDENRKDHHPPLR